MCLFKKGKITAGNNKEKFTMQEKEKRGFYLYHWVDKNELG